MRHSVWLTLLTFTVAAFIPLMALSATHAQEAAVQDAAAAVAEAATDKDEAGAKDDKAAEEKKKAPETVEVVKKPVKVFQTLTGALESQKTVEIKTDFEKWTDLKIKTVAKQGEVAQGAALVEFDTESLDKAITEAEFALRSAQFAHRMAPLDAKKSAQTFELDNAMAELAWRTAQEDNQYYKDITVPQREKDLAYDEKSSGYYLEYSNDELDQLQQMYTEDDLTEESEAIVLKRAQRSVESAERQRERSMRRINRSRKYDIPRTDQREAHSLVQSQMAYEKSQVSLPIAKERAEIAMAKADFDLVQKEKALKELVEDRAKMTLNAPSGGIMFYGENERGKWKSGIGGSRDLEKDRKVTAKAVIMTIVDASQMTVRANIEEANLSSFAPGLSGKAKFESAGGKIIPVTIDSIERIPMNDGKYDCKVNMQGVAQDVNLLPGMGCKMSFLVYVNNDAMVVPKASVFSDDDGFTHYVYVFREGSEPERVEVETGKTSGDDIEILNGLSVGDKITKKKP